MSTGVYQCGQCGGLGDDLSGCKCLHKSLSREERSRRRAHAAKQLGVDRYDYTLVGDRFVRTKKTS